MARYLIRTRLGETHGSYFDDRIERFVTDCGREFSTRECDDWTSVGTGSWEVNVAECDHDPEAMAAREAQYESARIVARAQ